MILPSKELLAEILGYEVFKLELQRNELVYTFDESCGLPKPIFRTTRINIYELMHIMKEWLYKKEIMYDIKCHTNRKQRQVCIMTYGAGSSHYCGKTEFEAVCKICEWVLNEKEK